MMQFILIVAAKLLLVLGVVSCIVLILEGKLSGLDELRRVGLGLILATITGIVLASF